MQPGDRANDDLFEQRKRSLQSPDVFPEPTTSVEVIETHISLVLLTERFVYKLKKPVRFDFLDFSTAELRHRACEDELRLNRRLAPDVYLEVVPLVRTAAGALSIAGKGEPIDWLVKMNRLADEDTLLTAIERQSVSKAGQDALAERLADFYRSEPPLPISAAEYQAEIERHVRGNQAELLRVEHAFPAHEIRRVHAAQLLYLLLHPEVFSARVQAGRVVDGHGDLRPEHIYLTAPPVIIDCIEFSDEFRTVDLLDELCFLETECAMLGAERVGRAVREKCLRLVGDEPSNELAAFYKSYRACVRGKVAMLRARQLSGDTAESERNLARRYLQLADEFDEQLGPPLMIAVGGLSGTGKSTIAGELAERFGIEVLQTDAVRQQLVDEGKLATGADKYSQPNRDLVYRAMHDRAADLLEQHSSVILDGTYITAAQQQHVEQLAAKSNSPWLFIYCHCPIEIAEQRIANRQKTGKTLSEAKPALVAQQAVSECQIPTHWPVFECDTTLPVEGLVTSITGRLMQLLSEPR